MTDYTEPKILTGSEFTKMTEEQRDQVNEAIVKAMGCRVTSDGYPADAPSMLAFIKLKMNVIDYEEHYHGELRELTTRNLEASANALTVALTLQNWLQRGGTIKFLAPNPLGANN